MGININIPNVTITKENDIRLEEKEYNIQLERKEIVEKFENSLEVDEIASKIVVYEPETIVSFGNEVAGEIAKCSDTILNSINLSQINETGEMLLLLGKIMDKFDLNEIVEKPGLFQKLFGNIKKQIENILAKYYTMGEEIDKIYIKLKQYEDEIKQSNKKLDMMFQTNINYYQELMKYILAGEQGIKELSIYIRQREEELNRSNAKEIQLDLDTLYQAKEILEQRVQDLRIAENVAIQSIPMLKTMQFSNINLIRKINSAFIITLPIFKQALSQAILLKRQQIQAEAISALDKKTNEILIKNAQNTVEQAKLTVKMASGNSIRIETLENTWKTIMLGIEETKKIQIEATQKRLEDKKRLEIIKDDFNNTFRNQR